MLNLRLTAGMPEEPDTGDYDAICDSPSPERFFAVLCHETAGFQWPEPVIVSDEADDVRRTRTGWYGSQALGVEITVVSCEETSDFPTYYYWETRGLPGMRVKWNYGLEYAGQLGHVAYRHGNVECTFDSLTEQQRFSEVWKRVIGKEPEFEESK